MSYYLGKSKNLLVERIFMSDDLSTNGHQNMKSKNYVCKKTLFCSKSFFKRLVLRKQMGSLQVEIDTHNELRRSLTSIQMIGIGIGSIIGE
jgi:hypothetical protein